MSNDVGRIRNVALIAPGGSGKTSLAEAMLFTTKATERLGSVEKGTSVLDYEPEEIRRHMSISAAFHHYEWNNHWVNIIDTPGDDNFLSDTIIALQGADGAILVVDAVEGVKFQTEKILGYANRYGLPCLIFVSKLDKEHANFEGVIEELSNSLNIKAVPVCLPLGNGEAFEGIINLLSMQAWIYQKDGSGKFTKKEIPEAYKDKAEEFREKMVEYLAETDDALLERYLEGEEIKDEEWQQALHQGTVKKLFIPVVCGSGLLNIGIQLLLDLVNHCLPSPKERGPVVGIHPDTKEEVKRKPNPEEPFSALVIKTISDPFAGRITVFRVFSGTLRSDTTILNSTKGFKEKVGQLFALAGKTQRLLQEVKVGDIAAVAKLKETLTNDTLCDEKSPIVFKAAEPLPSVISFAIEPKSKGDEEKIYSSLVKLAEEDPALRLERDSQTKELILSGTGQLHIENTIEKLKRKYGVEVTLKSPKIPYKETIKGKAKAQGKYKKQTGGRGQYGDAWIEIEPLPRGEGFEFVDKIVGGVIPRNYIPAVEKGIKGAMAEGILAGYPVVDVRVYLVDGSYHPVDSSDMAFQIAGSMAFKKAFMEAKPILLEPVMKLTITVPDELMGDVIGDINSRRGKVLGFEAKSKYQVITALVPMAEILTYASDLTSITGGKASFTMEFSHYEEVPAPLAEKIVEEAKKEKEG
ncbi:MAG: elongation factor G [Candidatus Desulfofervidaceae bacterium]|nr:elongation factor G [Candidatus Desulfofervidaceae bacterium]